MNVIEVACVQCGKPVSKFPSQLRERNYCSRACLGAYRSDHYIGTNSAHWKGGERKDRERVMIHMPSHPRANSKGYVYRYWVVAEQKIGRSLLPGEVVHHDDDDQSNDHPDNLIIFPNQSEHARHHGLRRSPEQMEAMRNARA